MRGRHFIWSAIGIVLGVGIWAVVSSPDRPLLPPPEQVLKELYRMAATGTLVRDVGVSVQRVLLGLGLASCIAFALGLLTALWASFGLIIGGPIELLRPIPPLAWAPIAIMAFGVGDAPAVAIVAVGAFFPIWLGIAQGLSEIRLQHIMAARSLGASNATLLVAVVWPSMAPYVFHGLRVGAGLGWFSLVAAEMMGASSGLGYGIQVFSLNLEIIRFYAYLVMIGALGLTFNALLAALGRRIVFWREVDHAGY
jgi:NitT/TauT family transport system permease protein